MTFEIEYVYQDNHITEKDLEEIKKICEALQKYGTLHISVKSRLAITSQK